eukprot:11237084-Karenia_brevis.AAC.1
MLNPWHARCLQPSDSRVASPNSFQGLWHVWSKAWALCLPRQPGHAGSLYVAMSRSASLNTSTSSKPVRKGPYEPEQSTSS